MYNTPLAMLRLSAIICLSLAVHQAISQSSAVRNYSVSEGLPNSEVYEVFQDKQGFIWISTDNGVAKFDGKDMTVFRPAEGLEDPVVFGMQEDHRGRIWFRTYTGRLFYYEKEKIIPYQYNDILIQKCKKALLTSVYVDSKETVWFGIPGLTGQINVNGEVLIDSIPPDHITYKSVEENGYMLAQNTSWNTDLFYFNVDGRIFPIKFVLKSHMVGVLCTMRWRNNIYFTLDNTIFAYDGNSIEKVFTGAAGIISLSKDADDNLWVGYANIGAERFDNTDFKNPWRPSFLSNKSVSKVLDDNERGLWISTLESGVYYVPELSFKLYPYADSSKVKSVFTSKDMVMYGTYDGSFRMLDAQKKKTIYKKKYLASIHGLYRDSRKNIWIAAHRLLILDQNFYEKNIGGGTALDFAEDGNGYLWAMSSNAMFKFDTAKNVLLAATSKARFRNMLVEDSIIYIAERLGLHVYDTSMKLIEAPQSLSRFKISKILSLNDSLMFIATVGNGFQIADKRSWICNQFNTKNNFIADNIYAAIIIDSTLWLGTEKGVIKTNIRSLIKREPVFVRYDRNSGLYGDKTNFLGHANNEIWAFSDQGISVIPTITHSGNRIPKFFFKTLYINKVRTAFDEEISLPHNATNIALTFGFLSLKNQNISCRYQLTENDPWIYTNERNLQFSSLAPGEYKFNLEYSIDLFHWTRADATLKFIVTPPWWQLWYIQVLAFLILGLLVFLYFRNHYRILQKHQQKIIQAEFETLERERNRIAKELHDGVATNLGAIKLMVNHLLRSHKEPMAGELDEHFLYTIKEIKGIIYGLTPPGLERDGLFAGLKNYIEKLNKTIPIKIHLDIQGKEIHEPELGLLSFRIIQELLSNAVRHASAKNISIEVNSKAKELSLAFQDDGIGFSYEPGKSGLGLVNVESRVESVNGTIRCESGAAGTSYNITIPVN